MASPQGFQKHCPRRFESDLSLCCLAWNPDGLLGDMMVINFRCRCSNDAVARYQSSLLSVTRKLSTFNSLGASRGCWRF